MDTNCAEEWSCAKDVADYLKAIVYVASLNEFSVQSFYLLS